ncbi:MAG: hypothetical protein HY553_22750 [Elusimicrobia bacterium]|nr:hypothetical protein [Elusimicrobiota bacterium]
MPAGAALGILAALLAANAAARDGCPRSTPENERRLADPPPASARIAVDVVLLRGTGWSRDVVERRLGRLGAVLRQCGVRLDAAITEASAPGAATRPLYDRARAQAPNGLGTITRALRTSARPVLFYIGPFEDNPGQATSRPRFDSAGLDEVDTAWVPYGLGEGGAHACYLVDAHELVHTLADVGHPSLEYDGPRRARKEDPPYPGEQDGGLMAGNPGARTNVLGASVCDRLRKGPFAERL